MLLSGVGFHISYNSTSPFTKIVDGNIDDLNAALYEELLAKIDFSAYVNKSIIIKAVRKSRFLHVPILAAQYLQPYARIMYGEACSAVPLYKAKKNRMN
jgi:hypothetical protein